MPAHNRVGLDDDHRVQAKRPYPVQKYPDQAIDESQARTKLTTPVDHEKLMAYREQLTFERGPGAESRDDRIEQQIEEHSHAPMLCVSARIDTGQLRMRFSAGTGGTTSTYSAVEPVAAIAPKVRLTKMSFPFGKFNPIQVCLGPGSYRTVRTDSNPCQRRGIDVIISSIQTLSVLMRASSWRIVSSSMAHVRMT